MWTRFALLAALLGAAASPSTVSADDLTCHEIPVVVVTAESGAFPDATCNQLRFPAEDCLKAKVHSHIRVIDHADGSLNCLSSEPTAEADAKTNYRGQTSLFFAKHQLGVKFSDAQSFVGFPADKDFILNGPYLDCSLMRNHLGHWLFRSTGRYAARSRHVAVYFSDTPGASPRYIGVYLALEKLGFGKNRVGLSTMDTSCRGKELNGGWAWHNDPSGFGDFSPNVVIDQYQNEFGMGERPVLAYPSGEKTSQLMRDYFVNTTQGFLPQLYRFLWNNMTDPDGIEAHIDLGSYADYILHTEMSLNVDAYRRSTYFHKDRDQTINAGPVWDLDLAYGDGARRNFHEWIYPQYTYWKRLVCNYKLASLMIQRWKHLRSDGQPWSDASIVKFVDESAAPVKRQLQKCTGDWRSDVLQCVSVDVGTCNGTYVERLDDLKMSVLNRAKWMDEHILDLYKKLDGQTCGYVGEIPKFNCAKDGNDGGCLTDPAKYYTAVTFPPVRKPYNGPACGSSEEVGAMSDYPMMAEAVRPSVDYCWLATGASSIYPMEKGVREKSLTNFCGGYGSCPQGAGAKCTCSVGVEVDPVNCRRIDAAYIEEREAAKALIVAEGMAQQDGKRSVGTHAFVKSFFGLLMLFAMVAVAYKYKQHRRYQNLPTNSRNLQSPGRYGSLESRPLVLSSPRLV